MRRIDWTFDEDDISVGDDLRMEYKGEPFTGELVTSLGDQLLSQAFYVDGIKHGHDRKWWATGQLRYEGETRNGWAYGVFREWHRNGVSATEKHFDEMGDLDTVREWDEDGNPVDDSTSEVGRNLPDVRDTEDADGQHR